MKRHLPVLLLPILLICLLVLPAHAAEGNSWSSDAVRWAVANGYLTGDGTSLALDRVCTFHELSVLIWRAAGSPASTARQSVPVPEDAWYYGAACWMAEKRYPWAGTPETQYYMDRGMTILTMGALLADGYTDAWSHPFTDLDTWTGSRENRYGLNLYAGWAYQSGITRGTWDGLFAPNALVDREQAVTLLYRWAMGEKGYVTQPTPVFRETLTGEKLDLRFYSTLPHVPYVEVSAYYNMLIPGRELTTRQTGYGVFLLQNPFGQATVDVNRDTISSPDLMAFLNLMDQVQPGLDNVYLDGLPFVRVEQVVYDRKPQPVTLSLGSYGIDLCTDLGQVWMPLATLSDLFSDLHYHYTCWNGLNVYVNEDNDLAPMYQRDPNYYDWMLSSGTRPADLASFTYRELSFALSTFYGYPGRSPLEGALAIGGLTAALDSFGPMGVKTRELLQSTDVGDYLTGMLRLGYLLWDGGHTVFSSALLYSDLTVNPEREAILLSLREKWVDLIDDIADYADAVDAGSAFADWEKLEMLRDAAWGKDSLYQKVGNTAVLALNSFAGLDMEGWRAYYAGLGPMPSVENDPMSLLVTALNMAEADPEVNNFLLDLSTNGGGSVDMVAAVLSLLTGDREILYDNTLTGQRVREVFTVDRNLDGVFDSRDDLVQYHLNLGVVTSRVSFSCANLFPSLMRDRGIPLLGDRSGGGTCAVQMMTTADGFSYSISSYAGKLLNQAGESIDGGIPVDLELVRWNPDGTRDYSQFYDLALWNWAINLFYSSAAS